MHGRIKVRTTAEEAEKKRKEQEIKVKIYRAAMKKILEKRKNSNYDDEMLQIIGQVLLKNPDIYTLWNIRKETLKKLLENSENSIEKELELFPRELLFAEQCLMSNPKSYGAWHHRCWILENSQKPNWEHEIELCTKYLNLDERNFHVWDYRRYVAEKANVAKKSELDFCTDKIRKNFSNYSSWHYRSKLLPIIHPHPSIKNRPISEEILKEELETVLTAAFTDPADSSAWFYQRWLLGYSEPNLDIASFRLSKNKLLISFTKAVNMNNIIVQLGPCLLDPKKWKASNEEDEFDTIWTFNGCFKINFKRIYVNIGKLKFELELKKSPSGVLYGFKVPKFQYEFEKAVLDELKGQLSSCEELLQHEPDSKWTLLTAALLMRAIDRKVYHLRCVEFLKKLEEVDSMRIGYYRDLASKWKIENALENCQTIPDTLVLSNLDLTVLSHEQFLCVFDRINISKNSLRSVKKLSLLKLTKLTISSDLLEKFNLNNVDNKKYNVDTIIGDCKKKSDDSKGK